MNKKTFLFGFAVIAVLVACITLGIVWKISHDDDDDDDKDVERSFEIGETDFIMNGKKFQYVSGSFHYFRALSETWEDKLRVMQAAGLNAVDTYVEWSLHNPEPGVYNWDNFANLAYFLDLAHNLGFYVILRPGPYICAERDNGGLPYWLFTKYPNIKVRTSDSDFLAEVRTWYKILFEKIDKYLYGNGGPIIMVQIENEYGGFRACDKIYTQWLKNETEKYVGENAILFTVDIPNDNMHCGIIDGVFATTDFGYNRAWEMDAIWARLREFQPTGPLVNSEYYPGWLTHWQEENQRRDADAVAETLREMLKAGASVNLYMFFGGTNFGFSAGANVYDDGTYEADITSYDYDAPMDESGNATDKFIKIRNVISEFFGQPSVALPAGKKSIAYPTMTLRPIEQLFSDNTRRVLGKMKFTSERPLTFETIKQFSGLVLYETELPEFMIDPTILTVNDLRDRAIIFVDGILMGVLSRENAIFSMPLNAGLGNKLQILVENQGRSNYGVLDDVKGILGNVTLQLFEPPDQELTDWEIIGFPLTSQTEINGFIDEFMSQTIALTSTKGHLIEGPVFFYGELDLQEDEIFDTYLDPRGWGKGVLYVNGFNVGRYWPLVGPQITMYIPAELLRPGTNTIVMLEYQKVPIPIYISFLDHSLLDGL